MPKLLIKLTDHTHPDPNIDRKGAYKRGMVIAVMPDDHIFGILEDKRQWIAFGNDPQSWAGKLGVIELSGVTKEDIDNISYEEYVGEDVYRRREWMINIDSVPQPHLNQLLNDGYVSMPAASLNGLVHKISNPSVIHGRFGGL